jgi:hypothetical protein
VVFSLAHFDLGGGKIECTYTVTNTDVDNDVTFTLKADCACLKCK